MTSEVNQNINVDVELDSKEDQSSNVSHNREFSDIVKANVSRRTVLEGTLAGAAASFLAPSALGSWSNEENTSRWGWQGDLVDFEPVSIEQAAMDQSMPTISVDYEYQVLIPWGTPIEPGATEEWAGDPTTRPSSAQAALQIGIGHDGMWFFPKKGGRGFSYGFNEDRNSDSKGMLCINHEFGRNSHVLGKDGPESLEDVRLSQNVHGVSVVAIEKEYSEWRVVRSKNSRRITVNTPMTFSGPAAESELLQNPNGNIPLGTVNNCGSGPTPWGTYLTCEENFNGYFGASEGESFNDRRTEEQLRYGIDWDGFGYGWEYFDRRFDLSDDDYVNESNRFGWVVEIDPYDGTQTPVKRTALGRFKHEAVVINETRDGRVVAYMGDDQRGDYCYKFVSDEPWQIAQRYGRSPLDEGTLFVARFNEDGTGEWLPLDVEADERLAARFTDQAELLIYTRLAADIVGATKMDRPEWVAVGKRGLVYWTLTNNTAKADGQGEQNAANPEFDNTDGHIIRMRDGKRGAGTHFRWEIWLLASSTRETAGVFTDPDAAYADRAGRLFIGTDGGQPDGLQDQLVVFDTTKESPDPQRLLVGVVSDEITGFAHTPDHRTAFVNVQHPGNGSPEDTNFPAHYDGITIPRDATLVITRKDGGVVGS